MMLAVKEGLKRGYTTLSFTAAQEGAVSTICLLIYRLLCICRQRGALGSLYGCDYIITSITNGFIELPAQIGATVSVFAHGGAAEGVTLSGLKYPLSDALLQPDFPLGVSNEACAENISIEVKRGTLVIVLYNQ